jgi:hypothetical protein
MIRNRAHLGIYRIVNLLGPRRNVVDEPLASSRVFIKPQDWVLNNRRASAYLDKILPVWARAWLRGINVRKTVSVGIYKGVRSIRESHMRHLNWFTVPVDQVDIADRALTNILSE